MELDSLEKLYVDELKDLYSAEGQILKALPRMAKAASHPELKRAFLEHERQTRKQVERLERIFKDLGTSPRGKKCHGMEGLLEEAKELIGEKPDPDVLDAGLIGKAQHVEHYEMAGYGTVRTYAQQLGHERHAQLLQETLDEEGETDKKLTELAVSSINLEAEDGGDENAEGDEGGSSSGSSGGGSRGGSRGGRGGGSSAKKGRGR